MADKETKLSITLGLVDKATARIKAVNERLDAITKPIRDFKESLSDLREKSGLDDVIGGFKGVGSALMGILAKVALVGGVVGIAVHGLVSLVDHFDDLGDRAERIGVSVDFLAQMRFAAETTGAAVESLDAGVETFTKNLGLARANTGKLAAFLGGPKGVSPALLSQLKAAKSNEAAFGLLADAMVKLKDPAKRAALASKAFGGIELAPLFAKGAKGVKELRDRYAELAPGQAEAAKAAGQTDDAFKELHATTDGIKAALVTGLAPALTVIVNQLRDWFKDNRSRVAEFAAALGKKLPDAFHALVDGVKSVIDFIRPFVDSTTKLKVLAVALAGIIVGPLVSAIYGLGVALLTTPVGWIVTGIAAIAAGAYLLISNWDAVSDFFVDMWDTIKAKFGWATDLILTIAAPFLAVPLLIIEHWGGIADFFGNLWGVITSVFQKAWAIIGAIVDRVVAAVDTIKGALGALGGSISLDDARTQMGGTPVADVLAQSRATIDAARGRSTEARVMVDFANAPRGTRVKADPQSTADVDLSVGYQMLGLQ